MLKNLRICTVWVYTDYIVRKPCLTGNGSLPGRRSQYPVFPWPLTDFTSAELDLRNPAVSARESATLPREFTSLSLDVKHTAANACEHFSDFFRMSGVG